MCFSRRRRMRWRGREKTSTDEHLQFAATSTEVHSLAAEIADCTISKVMANPDLELGIEALHRDDPDPILRTRTVWKSPPSTFAAEY
jgi:hypothetical protein